VIDVNASSRALLGVGQPLLEGLDALEQVQVRGDGGVDRQRFLQRGGDRVTLTGRTVVRPRRCHRRGECCERVVTTVRAQ
jgi:hypothetical protein